MKLLKIGISRTEAARILDHGGKIIWRKPGIGNKRLPAVLYIKRGGDSEDLKKRFKPGLIVAVGWATRTSMSNQLRVLEVRARGPNGPFEQARKAMDEIGAAPAFQAGMQAISFHPLHAQASRGLILDVKNKIVTDRMILELLGINGNLVQARLYGNDDESALLDLQGHEVGV